MNVIGYARVSTTDQDVSIQEAALRAAGCGMVRSERVTGTSTVNRTELRYILDFIRPGDTLCVTRVDRLARSMGDLQDIVRELKAKGAALRITEQAIDTSTAAGKAFLDMLGVFAEFETNIRADRQREGIAKAKAAGVYKGRPDRTGDFKLPPEVIKAKVDELDSVSGAARALGIGRTTVYRALEALGVMEPA